MNVDPVLIITMVLVAISFGVGHTLGVALERRWWKGEMINRRHAMYYYWDGKWYWNEDIPKAKDPAATAVKKNPLSVV